MLMIHQQRQQPIFINFQYPTKLCCYKAINMSLLRSEKTAQEKLQQNYEILNPIGHGSFGYILAVRNKSTGNLYACKVEKHHGKKVVLVEKQFQIMFSIQQYPSFPTVYEIHKFKEHSYVIMEKFDHTLNEHFITKNKKFSLPTIALLTDQCFTAIKMLHQAGYLHRDLKPQNFMIKNYTHQIKLIDFGLADGTRVKKANTLIGNVRFSSRGAHFGMSSQKDDLESLVYVLYHLMMGELPWEHSTKTEIEMQINRRADKNPEMETPILLKKNNFVRDIKFPETKNQIKKVFYEQYLQLIKYIMELDPQVEPNYSFIDQKCSRLIILGGTRRGSCFDWCFQHCPKKPTHNLWDVFKE